MNWWAVGIGAAITAISLINAGIKKYKENLREAAQESARQAEESARAVESLTELKAQLEDGSKSTNDLSTAFKEQLKQMGYTEAGIDNLIKKYGGLEEAIKGTTEEVLAKNLADARGAKDDAKKSALTELGELVEGFTYEGGFIRLAFSVDNWIPEDIGQYSKEIQDEFQKFYDLGENADSTQNIDDLLAYYNQAQKVLDLLKNAAIDDEDIYNESAYLQAKSAVDKLSASMDGYANAITRVHEADAQIELANFLKTNDIATQEDFDSYIKGIEDGTIGMVDGKEASDSYKQALIDVANDAFPQFSNSAKDAGENVNKMTVSLANSLDNLEKTKSSIKTLSDGLKEFEEEGSLSFSSISAIGEAFSDVDGIENYIARLSDAGLTSQEFREISGELTIALIEQKLETGELTDADEKLVAKMLEEAGVANSAEVAHEMLTKAKVMQYIKTLDLNNVTNAEIQELANLAGQCGVTEQQLSLLTRAMEILANTDLNLGDKCTQLLQMAATAGIAMASLGTASSLLTDMQNGSIGALKQSEQVYSKKSITDLYKESIQETLNYFSGLSGEIVNIPATTYKPSKDKKNKDKKNSESDTVSKPDFNDFDTDTSYYSEIEAWLEEGDRQITNIDFEISTLNKKLENTLETGNIEEAKIWEKALNEKLTEKQNLLHSYNEANRTTMDSLIKEIWSIAPELDGKSWDEITEVEKSQVIKRYEDAITLAKNNVITVQNAGKQALYNYDVAHNGKDKNEAERVEIEDANKATEKSAQAGVDSAEAILNKVKGIFNDAKLVSEDIKDNSEEWWNVDSTRISNYKALIDGQETFSNTWLENEIAFNRISEAGQMNAYGRMINNMKEFQKKILADETLSAEAREALWKYTNEKIIQHGKDAYTKGFSAIENAMSEALDEFNDEIESKTEYREFRRSKIDSRHTLLQKYFEVVNAISDASHEIDKELRASKAMEEYLDENTRKLLFND